jgi:hypothetical protein
VGPHWQVISRLGTLATLFICWAGCSKPPHEVAPVHGTVTIDGQPFTQGKVMFAPLASGHNLHPGKAAMGILKPDGSFVLGTYGENDGAVVGEHSVTIINVKTPAAASTDANANATSPKAFLKFDRARAPGTFRVVAGEDNQFDIKLSSREIARAGGS